MSDPILINILIQSEGLSGQSAEKRRAELEKKSASELQELLSKSSGRASYELSFYQSVGWMPKAKPQPKYTSGQQEAMQFMKEMLADAMKTMYEQDKKENSVSKGVNFVKEVFNTEYAQSNVNSAIQSFQQDFSAIEEAARKVPSEFEIEFQQRRGVKFDEKKIAECSQKAKDMAEFQASTDVIEGLKAKLKNALVNDTSNNFTRAGERAILETLSTMGYTKIGEVIQAAMKGHENDPAVKDYLKEDGSFAVRKDKNGKIGIYRETKEGGWQPITQEQAQIIGKEIELRLNKLHSNILGVEIPENATSEEIAKLNEEKMVQYQEDYEKSFAQAYGKKDLKQLAQNYVVSQEQGQAYVQMGVNILAMAGAMFSGGGSLALVSTGVMLTNPVGFIQKATDADGMTAEDWKTYGSEFIEQAGWMALGMGAGKVGDLTRSFVKVKGLAKVMQDGGKSLDDFIKIAAKSPDIPADVAKSLKTVTRLANTAGVTTEVAADMATTMALQKDGATEMDWIMSIGGSLVGTKMQKVLAPMSGDAKVAYVMDAFKDFKLSETEAKQLLKAMDDSAKGIAPLKKQDLSNNSQYQAELADLNERFKNKEISAPELLAAKKDLKAKYEQKNTLNPSQTSQIDQNASIKEDVQTNPAQKSGSVLEGGIRADELDEVAPFAQRLEDSSDVGDYIPVSTQKLDIKEFKNKLVSLTDSKDGTQLFKKLDSEFFIDKFGAENIAEVSKFIDFARQKYDDNFVKECLLSANTDNKIDPIDKIKLQRDLIENFDNTPENAQSLLSLFWNINSTQFKAAQILLDMPKRENSTDAQWSDLNNFIEKVESFDTNKSVEALNRAVTLQINNGAKAFGVKDIDKIIQIKDLLLSNDFSDDEVVKLYLSLVGVAKNSNDFGYIAEVIASPKNKDLQTEIKENLKDDRFMNIVVRMHELQPKIYDKVYATKITTNGIKDKTLKALVKRNIKKIKDPQKKIAFIEQMKTTLPELSKVQDKYILSKIYAETSNIVERLNTNDVEVKSEDYLTLIEYENIDKEFRGDNAYVYGNASAYLEYMEKEYPDSAKVFKDLVEKYKTMSQEDFDAYFEQHTTPEITKLGVTNYVKDKQIEQLKNYINQNSYKEGNLNYSKKELDSISRFYRDKYLSKLPEAARESCEKIYDSFGVKMFLADENDTKVLDFVYNELLEWQKASRGKAQMPPVIDLSVIKKKYIDKVFQSSGYCNSVTKNISINGRYLENIRFTLRHEIAHANDSKIKTEDGIITVYNKDGSQEEIDIDEIIVHKRVQKLDSDGKLMFNPDGTPIMEKARAEDGTLDPDLDKCKYVEEFENAGIPEWHIPYAYTDKSEFLAVAAEGDYSKYSPEFKELLVKLGLPKWMFNMKAMDNVNTDLNIYTNNKFAHKYSAEDNQKISANSEKFFNWVSKSSNEIKNDYLEFIDQTFGTLSTRVKDLEGLNEKIYREIDRIDQKIADLENIDEYNATKLKKGDEPLTQEAADILIEKYNMQKQNLINDYDTVINTIQDAFGARLVLDDASPVAIAKIHQSLLNAIDSGEIKILEINNYQGEGSIPYFSSAQIKQLQAHCRRQGYELKVISDVNAPVGKEDLYNKDYNSQKAIKASGYTTCQMNIQHKNGVISEFQIRGKYINELAESEHIFYDISQNKDLSKGNPKIKAITDPLVKVVENMNAKGNEHIKAAYSKYLTECYKFARMKELGIPMKKPVLPDIVDPMLDIDNIINIHNQITSIK